MKSLHPERFFYSEGARLCLISCGSLGGYNILFLRIAWVSWKNPIIHTFPSQIVVELNALERIHPSIIDFGLSIHHPT